METTNTVKTDPVLEAIKRKLSGYNTVPPTEQTKMIKRAAKAARDAAQDEYLEIIRELREALKIYEEETFDNGCSHRSTSELSKLIDRTEVFR